MLENLFSPPRSHLLESAFEDVGRMLEQSEKMLGLAIRALYDNQAIQEDLDRLDDVVDEGERLVRRTVLEHLAVQPERDLVASLILVSIVQDAERIGDFARGLAELIPLARSERRGPICDRLRQLAQAVREVFPATASAFRSGDAEAARSVIQTTNELKEELVRVVEEIAGSELSADMAVVYSASARMLRRIAAHLSNIASTVSQPYDRIRHGDEEA